MDGRTNVRLRGFRVLGMAEWRLSCLRLGIWSLLFEREVMIWVKFIRGRGYDIELFTFAHARCHNVFEWRFYEEYVRRSTIMLVRSRLGA